METCPELEAWKDAYARLPVGFTDELRAHVAYGRAARTVKGLRTGRGIVICGGGPVHGPNALRLVRRLRTVGCALPVQVWRLPGEHLDESALAWYGAKIVTSLPIEQHRPGYALKTIGILSSGLAEVLYLDADNWPLTDPTPVFDWPEFRHTGAVFWPDCMAMPAATWEAHGLPAPAYAPMWETGQLVVNVVRHQAALYVARWLCNWDAHSFRVTVGDCEAFQLAWAACDADAWIVEHKADWNTAGRMVANKDRDGRPLFVR